MIIYATALLTNFGLVFLVMFWAVVALCVFSFLIGLFLNLWKKNRN